MKSYLLLLLVSVFVSCNPSAKKGLSRTDKRDNILKNIIPPKISEDTLLLTQFGAIGDSLSDCKPAFDKAIQATNEQNGGIIVVSPGTYLVNGPIHLINNLSIDLQKGSKLVFGSNPTDYLPAVLTSWEGTFLYYYSPFIYGYQLENVAIIGDGIIDGNSADSFSKWAENQKESQLLSRKMNHENTPLKDRMFGG